MRIVLCGGDRRKRVVHAELDINNDIPPNIIRLNKEKLYRYSHYNYVKDRKKQFHYVETDAVDVTLEVIKNENS